MNIEESHQRVNEIYSNNFEFILKGFRENNDIDEISYDLEEVFEDDNTLGCLVDYLVENEKCQVWDIPYITFLILNHPEKLYTYFEN
ncbi:hypothetical protein OAV92_01205 [Crocinitomicaceae bacterium]|nr:hypothetical protein [Crocinitomicaceae bacterium]